MSDSKRHEKRRCDRASKRVLELLIHDSYLPRRLSYRTGQDTANCDTCRNSACIIYRLVVVALQRQRDTNVSCPLSFLHQRQQRDRQRAGGFNSNVDSFNEHTQTFPHHVLLLIRYISLRSVCVSPRACEAFQYSFTAFTYCWRVFQRCVSWILAKKKKTAWKIVVGVGKRWNIIKNIITVNVCLL